MKLPSDLSGQDLLATLCSRWGYVKVDQIGSQIILQAQELAAVRVAVAFAHI